MEIRRAELEIRALVDDDAYDLIGLVAVCFAAYPGVALEVPTEMPHLLAPGAYYARHGGRAWAAVDDGGRLVGSVASLPVDALAVRELKLLYVHPRARRSGLGAALVGVVEDDARAAAAHAVLLWSDAKFVDAHRLYERLGYTRTGATRELHDLSDTVELGFRKSL